MKTTYIKERDVVNVANDLEIIISEEQVIEVLNMFDNEMTTYPPSINVKWEIVVQDLLNYLKTEEYLSMYN